MKSLYFVRHAKSSWRDPLLSDEMRPLNSRGKRDAPYMASMMADNESSPDLLISSTAVRAKRTANHFLKAFGLDKSKLVKDQRLYLASPQAMLDVIRELPNDYSTIYLFGHNPGMTEIANHFSDEYVDNVPTCGIVKITCNINEWYELNKQNSRRTQFYYPKQFGSRN